MADEVHGHVVVEAGVHAHDLPAEAFAVGSLAAAGDVGDGDGTSGLWGGALDEAGGGRAAGGGVAGGDGAADHVAFRSAFGEDGGGGFIPRHAVGVERAALGIEHGVGAFPGGFLAHEGFEEGGGGEAGGFEAGEGLAGQGCPEGVGLFPAAFPFEGVLDLGGAAAGVGAEAVEDGEFGGEVAVTVFGHAQATGGGGVEGVNGGIGLAALGDHLGFGVGLGFHLVFDAGDAVIPLHEGFLFPNPAGGEGGLHGAGGHGALEGGFDVLGHAFLGDGGWGMADGEGWGPVSSIQCAVFSGGWLGMGVSGVGKGKVGVGIVCGPAT